MFNVLTFTFTIGKNVIFDVLRDFSKSKRAVNHERV